MHASAMPSRQHEASRWAGSIHRDAHLEDGLDNTGGSSSSTSSFQSLNSKPNLSVAVESPPRLASQSPGHQAPFARWQQPYSELSRFPSASYRFRLPKSASMSASGQEWPSQAAAEYMMPLPSPLDARSRSLSDAVSDADSIASTSDYGKIEADSLRASIRSVPSRSRTSDFFASMDTAFSPPPPPRIASAQYNQDKKHSSEIRESSVLESSSADTNSSSQLLNDKQELLDANCENMSHSVDISRRHTTASTSPVQPLIDLPIAVRSDTHITTAAPLQAPFVQPNPPLLTTSFASVKLTPTVSTLNGQGGILSETPEPSPTEMQSLHSRWMRDPPTRLPTLLPELVPVSSTSTSRSSSPNNSASSSRPVPHESLSKLANTAETPSAEYEPGSVLGGNYEVLKKIGMGSFSQVVLARPKKGKTWARGADHGQTPFTSSSFSRETRGLSANAATGTDHTRNLSSGRSSTAGTASKLHDSIASEDDLKELKEAQQSLTEEYVVAIKMISRSQIQKNDRMRISIVREVEVLKHIRHPSLVPLKASFDSQYHTCLVLEYSRGGELFEFLAEHHEDMSEALARRIFGELADVLGWMHSIGLVHRDIKLENILLTSRPFISMLPQKSPHPADLPSIPTPFVKLTDFGLSRFIDPVSPYLETRCGSEEYAAPELIMGKRYDGRQTDAWALGVVLFAVTVGYMPFVEGADATNGSRSISSPRNAHSPSVNGSAKSRRNYLVRIAKGEYRWPEPAESANGRQTILDSIRMVSESLKTLVGGLLCREPKRRMRVEEVWDCHWMRGPGRPDKLSCRDGGLEGVSVAAFDGEGQEAVRSELPL